MFLQTKQIYTGWGINQSSSLVGRHLVLHPIIPASVQDVGLFLLLLSCTSSENHQTPDWPTSGENTIFFFCLVNKKHQHPGKCGKQELAGGEGTFWGQWTEHPPTVGQVVWAGCQDALPEQPELAQGMGQKGPGRNRVEKLLHHLE